MSLDNRQPRSTGDLPPDVPKPAPGRDPSRAVFLVLALPGLVLVGLSALPDDPIQAAASFTLGFVALTAAGIVGLMGRVRHAAIGSLPEIVANRR